MHDSVETRKLGKHLFIFEKRKAKSANDKAKGRTLIKSCTPEADEKLPPEFVKYMRTLFDILDEDNTGFVKLSDIEARWGQGDLTNSYEATGVLDHLRKVTPSNGLLSFEILCSGFGQALHSTENTQIANGFTGASNRYGNRKSSKTELKAISIGKPTGQKSPVSTIQVGKQGQASFPNSVAEKFYGFYRTANGIRENTPSQDTAELGQFSHKPRQERHIKSTSEPQQSINTHFTETAIKHRTKEQGRPLSVGPFGQRHQNINNPFLAKSSSESSKTDQQPEVGLLRADTVFIQGQKRPKSMMPLSEQKNPVDLSVARKKGGILEGIQKTDKKAVIDKLKQWRNEELRKSARSGVNGVGKQFQRTAQGYQSDTERGYYRQRRTVTPVSCTASETDSENRRNSKNRSGNSFGERFPRTTVYYQGQTRTKVGRINDSRLKTTTAECQSDVLRNSRVKDLSSIEDELHVLKEGLRIVDEVRDSLVKRIADIQEQKLYEELNNLSRDDVNAKPQDIVAETASERTSDKTSFVFERSHMESLATHFKGLKMILDQVKHPKNDR